MLDASGSTSESLYEELDPCLRPHLHIDASNGERSTRRKLGAPRNGAFSEANGLLGEGLESLPVQRHPDSRIKATPTFAHEFSTN